MVETARLAAFLQEEHNFYIDQRGLAWTRLLFLQVGRRLVAIHAATAADPALAAQFQTDAIFYDIRLEPYLVATAAAQAPAAFTAAAIDT